MRFLSFACLSLSLVACRSDALDSGHSPDGGTPPSTLACADLTDAASCSARSDCESSGCPDCSGNVVFQHCIDEGTGGAPFCPEPVCQPACDGHTTESACTADPSCVAIYDDPGTCDCAPIGCCMQFNRCAEGPAQCSPSGAGPSSCTQLPWDCGALYNPVFEGQCQIGCVKLAVCPDEEDCRTQGCDDGMKCVQCWTSYACIPNDAAC
jgi:hypothetical protein